MSDAGVVVANRVTHFEIYAEEPERLAGFYRELFGWTIERPPGIDYYRVQTGADSGDGLAGGLTYRPIPEPRSWVHYVSVDSVDDTIERVVALGGAVLREKSAVPKTAWYAVLEDPQGNVFAIWQPDPNAFPVLEPEL
jgi:predicted enzyme related to lactoylglutathione lyase